MSGKRYKTRLAFFEATITRFWSKVDRRGPDECWPWLGTISLPNKCGQRYGSFGFTEYGKCVSYRAHRFSWMIQNGTIPDGYVVMHSCDVPHCVNPAHLRAATQAENLADRDRKGRTARGEKMGTSRFTEDDIIAIRLADGTSAEIARDFGCDSTHIMRIRRGDCWRHLPMRDELTLIGKGLVTPDA